MDWLLPAEHLGAYALVALVAAAVTALAVVLHYEGLRLLAARHLRGGHGRRRMLTILFALLALHVAEIWCFGLAYWWLDDVPGVGEVVGLHGDIDTLFDAVYLSATTYTTVGFGDLAPVGAIRLLAGSESLAGLMLITWSASFTYLEMSKLWGGGRGAE